MDSKILNENLTSIIFKISLLINSTKIENPLTNDSFLKNNSVLESKINSVLMSNSTQTNLSLVNNSDNRTGRLLAPNI